MQVVVLEAPASVPGHFLMTAYNYEIGKYRVVLHERGEQEREVTVELAGKAQKFRIPNDPEFVSNDVRSFPLQVVVSRHQIRIGKEVVKFPELSAAGIDARCLAGLAQTLAATAQDQPHISSIGSVSSPNNPMLAVHIRWITRRDVQAIVDIGARTSIAPSREEDLKRHLERRNCIAMVAEHSEKIDGVRGQEKVVGFLIYELFKNKLQIINLAVDPNHTRSKVGSQLVSKLISKLSSHRRTKLEIVLREHNVKAQLFFRKLGFSATATRRGYFQDNGEAGITMSFCHPDT